MQEFLDQIAATSDLHALLDFCRRKALHGTPFVFGGDEEAYYGFRKKIAEKFGIDFHEVYITGSGKLGFSPHKGTPFSYDSDIDVAIVSTRLFDRMMGHIKDYQMQLRENRKTVSNREISSYHRFLEYSAIGWFRPDLLPFSFRVNEIKDDWFDFFNSISNGKSEVGNYQVSAGSFKSYKHLEDYIMSGLVSLKNRLTLGA